MVQNQSVHRHPLTSLLFLLLLVLAGYVLFGSLSLVLVNMVYGVSAVDIASGQAGAGVLKWIQGLTAFGAFILPPLILSAAERSYGISYFGKGRNVPAFLFVLTILIVFVSSPLAEWVIRWNQQLHLPGFLKGVETWMREKEDAMADLTRQLLTMRTVGDMLSNLLVVALIPAVGEELLFRGGLQNIVTRLTNNHHWAVWITAIIFSAIHVQFFGFFPRMLLGVLFGYLFVWTRSIWIAVLAHFINNGTVVIAAYVLQLKGKSLDDLDTTFQSTSGFGVAVSLVFTSLLLWIFYTRSERAGMISE